MKLIDKFLKKLNTSRNTFVTYVLTLISFYLAIDRIVEMLLMIFTGVSVSYWGPFMYTFALACPVFAFLFSGSSEFASSKNTKVTLFYTYVVGLYVIALSMFVQWINRGAWLLLISLPGYTELVTDYSELIKPALTSLAIYLPLVTFYSVFKFIRLGVGDSKDWTRSIWDYKGISLKDTKQGHGPFTCDLCVCNDFETGKKVQFVEKARYQSLLVVGGSGTGKTSLIIEPFVAKDIEKKAFYIATAKEMGYTALKTGIAVLNKPYDNEYLNQNFSLNMITPVDGKESIYKSYMNKMILASLGSSYSYRNLGITTLSPDYESTEKMINVCKNFHIKYNIIDPANRGSIGLNPFIYDDPNKIAITISAALKAMYVNAHPEIEDTYREEYIIQAVENLAIMLKEMYPRLNGGNLPNLEDMLKMLTNYSIVEKMCEIMCQDPELAEKYSNQITYFKRNFYENAPGKAITEQYLYLAVSQLDNLLRLPGVKTILCNRHNNIDFDKALANGEVTFVCTRRGDLGRVSHKAFGLFFLLSMQNAVLRRPGNENSRIPHFLYIDEFPDFICKATEPIFTMYRKYKIGTTISAQNLSQLETPTSKENYRQVILSNCGNKIFTGGGTAEDLKWWEVEFGQHREWDMSNSIDFDKMKYDSKHGNVSWKFIPNFKVGKLQSFGTKDCAYLIRDSGGKPVAGQGKLNFLESKYKEPKKIKTFDFGKYSDSVTTSTEDDNDLPTKKKFDLKHLDFTDDRNEFDPVQTDVTDSDYLFDNEDAIVVNLNKKKHN